MNYTVDNRWNEEEDALLMEMWTSKKSSASKIAVVLQERFGRVFTRNAVIGRVSRIGLRGKGAPPGNNNPKKPPKPRADRIVKKPAPPPPPMETPVETFEPISIPVSERVTLMDLRSGTCRFPIGDPLEEDFGFCGASCDIARPYCRTHSELCYRPIEKQAKVAWRAHK